jgi:hypothetical protein
VRILAPDLTAKITRMLAAANTRFDELKDVVRRQLDLPVDDNYTSPL